MQDFDGEFFGFLHVVDYEIVFFRKFVDGGEIVHIACGRNHGRCPNQTGDFLRQFIRAANVPRENRNHKATLLVYHEHGGVSRFVADERSNRTHGNSRRPNENERISFLEVNFYPFRKRDGIFSRRRSTIDRDFRKIEFAKLTRVGFFYERANPLSERKSCFGK